MDFWDISLHGINFLAPAVFVAALVTAAARMRSGTGGSWRVVFALVSAVSMAALVLGLVCFGNDGKMWSYVLMCVAAAGTASVLTAKRRKA